VLVRAVGVQEDAVHDPDVCIVIHHRPGDDRELRLPRHGAVMAVGPGPRKIPHNEAVTTNPTLVTPDSTHLPSYAGALRRGWSPSSEDALAGQRILQEIDADPDDYLASLQDRDPRGRTITMPDGSEAPRLPQLTRWMWDGEFCGLISVRWQPGTTELPPTCLGHVGYGVVPWKQRRGLATRALALILPIARDEGLPLVVITTNADNVASQRVILANGGRLNRRFEKPAVFGGGPMTEYVIDLI
jgi:predicted acetyltransferase